MGQPGPSSSSSMSSLAPVKQAQTTNQDTNDLDPQDSDDHSLARQLELASKIGLAHGRNLPFDANTGEILEDEIDAIKQMSKLKSESDEKGEGDTKKRKDVTGSEDEVMDLGYVRKKRKVKSQED